MAGMLKGIFAWWLSALLFSGCAQISQMSKTTKGAALGGLAGATAGGIIGGQSKHPVAGAAIGGALGALGGGLVGRSLDQQDTKLAEQQAKLDQQQSEVEKNRVLIEELKRRNIEARETSRGVAVNLPNVLFNFGSAELTAGGSERVRQIASILNRQAAGRRVAVEGHASRERADQETFNQRLSENRARSVEDALVSQGISKNRVEAKGFGTRFPIATNESEEGRRKNRRVEVIIEN
ncbi:MAG: OmpA family protein [Candidatus Binatia bacterium]|jgi:outer membrane protein OmpA-like peptidoglycan-associated protein|nr:OmpA family protein [Candidatus Binatia bacterium]